MASGLHLSSPDAMALTRISPTMSRKLEPTVPPRCMWATKEDWIANQGLISQVYEKQPLPRVMHLMETQYDFKATIKMYKTRIKQWGLNSKSQKHEIGVVAHPERQRQCVALGKRSTIHRPAGLFDVRDAIRAKKCRQVVADDNDNPQIVFTSSETMLECFTAVPTLLTIPGLLGTSERIFNTIRDYYRGSFESGMWVSDQEGTDCWTVKAGPGGASIEDTSKYLNALLHQGMLACQLFANKFFEEGGQALISGTARIKNIVQVEHPWTLIILFGLLLEVRRKNRQEIALAILRQFSAFAGLLLGDQHPLHQVCGWVASVNAACFAEVVGRCLKSAGDHFETNYGPMHMFTLEARMKGKELCLDMDTIQAEMLQRELLASVNMCLGSTSLES